MREFSLILFLFFSTTTTLANEFHVHSLKHVQKRHDIPLEFIMNSKEHSDIRRSVRMEKRDENLERMSSDKFVVRRDETPSRSSDSSIEVVGDATSVPDKFDQPSYDFMLPEGKSQNSTILAVVDFITRKHNVKPTFIVNFDENEWFDIGDVQKTKADNADVYKATVILRANANVAISKTQNGLYKFVVEAQQGDVVLAMTNISVDVISLAPTTKRARVTVPSGPPKMIMMTTTTIAATSSEKSTSSGDSESTTSKTSESTTSESPDYESDVLTLGVATATSSESPVTSSDKSTTTSGSDDDLTTHDPSESTTTSSDSVVTTSSELFTRSTPSESEATTSEPHLTDGDVIQVTDSESEVTTSSESSATSSEVTTSSEPITTSESTTSSESSATSSEVTTSSEPTTTSESTTSSESSATSSESTTSSESPATSSESSATSSQPSTTSSEEKEEEVEVLDSSGEGSSEISTSTTTSESRDVIESSGDSSELLTSSTSDSEDPISGPITILPLKTSQDGRIEPLDVHLELLGAPNHVIRIPRGARAGDVIRGIHVAFKGADHQKMELSIEPKDYLEIRPKTIFANEQAGLFLKKIPESENLSENRKKINLEIVAKIENSTVSRTPFQLNLSENSEILGQGSEMLTLREMEFAVLESAESGRTIGTVDEDWKIIGGNGNRRFSLVGNDLILSCGQFDTEKCLQNDPQKTFSLILMPKNGKLSPVQVTIQVQQRANLRTSDKVIRISDNRIISPFAVITERTRKNIKLDGDAAKFLGFLKAQEGLYQLIVVNSAASGRYTLQISLDDGLTTSSESPESSSPRQTIDVFVENSQSHAHFRKSKYPIEIDAKMVKNGLKLTQVELEGVPIDEAKIMILDGNPGWVTVEEYGGKVNVGKFDGPIFNGKFPIRIGAVDKKTWTILTETIVEIDVKNGKEPEENGEKTIKNSENSKILEATFDREKTEKFEVELMENDMKLDPKSMYGIDEKGQKITLDPTSITITPTHVQLAPTSLKSLRIVGLTLKNPENSQKINILIRLISTPEYLETQQKLADRPIYPHPWTRENPVIHVEMGEELAPGQVVGVYPAASPLRKSQNLTYIYSPRKIEIQGPMKEAFDFDGKTGELKIKQRIDFESLDENQKTFNLTLTSGDLGYKSEAILMVKVLDVDDNSPVIDMGGVEMLSLPENLAAGTKIAEFDVTDPDGSESYKVELEGEGSENFRANITSNGTLSIYIAENAKIDRETRDSMALQAKISDISGNSEKMILPIRILDVNDNAPEFEQKMYELEVMEDWPRGVVIHRIHAKDSDDVGPSSEVTYKILKDSEDSEDSENSDDVNVISINSTSGVVQISGDLWGKSRETSYKFHVIAEDSGAPTMNSTSILSMRIRRKEDVITEETVQFLEPKFGGAEILVKENLPLDTKIYTVKADLRGIPSKTRGKLVYSVKDLINSEKEATFAIDKDTGDIFVVKGIDFEKMKEYTLLITTTNSEDEEVTSSTILKIHVENLDDNEPKFLESALPVFEIPKNTTKPTAIGRLTAQDADGNPIFYHLLPNCGTTELLKNFTIDPEFGEIIYHPDNRITVDLQKIELCFIATSQKNLDLSEVFFDGNSPNFRKILIDFVENSDQGPENLVGRKNQGNQSISRIGDMLDRVEIPIFMNSGAADFELKNLQFVPANYELGRDMISPEGAVELNKKTGELVANGKILDTPQGVYTAEIEGQGSMAVKQLHHIKNERKLRYVLSMSRNEFGANLEKFKRQILEAIGKDDHQKTGGKQLDIHFDEPKTDRKNSTWTSVCFYLTRENAILDQKQTTSLISPTNAHISKLHHIFKVLNIDTCQPRTAASASATSSTSENATSSENPSEIPLNTLILIGVVGLLIIALIALLVFVCCVSKYQRYLKQKVDRMRCTSSTGSYYKSPNLIPPPPPGYMHTPPLPPPPPPPAAIAFY